MMAGPAYSAAAEPVSTKMPAPMTAPIPRVIRFTGPSARFRQCSPVSPASFINVSSDLVANKGLPMQLLLWGSAPISNRTANLALSIVGAQHAAPLQENLLIL